MIIYRPQKYRDEEDEGWKVRSTRSAYGQVCRIANTNQDKCTSLDEWSKVYEEVGAHFDELNPKDLNYDQLMTYLGKHKREIVEMEAKYGADFGREFERDYF